MNSQDLNHQITRIADETKGNVCRVILQMETDLELRNYLEDTTRAINQRRSVVSARALTPPPLDALQQKNGVRKKHANGRHVSLLGRRSEWEPMFRAANRVRESDAKLLKQAGGKTIQELMGTSWMKNLKSISRAGKRRQPQSALVSFWSSGSIALDLQKDDLIKLPENLGSIVTGVFPNRIVRTPPITKADREPRAVEDNKGYTWGVSRSGALGCWGAFGAKGQGVRVAVLDTGADATHPDLKGKITHFAHFNLDGDLVTKSRAKTKDSGQHGTHCCGSIAGRNTSGRWIGMAPEAELMVALVLDGDKGGSDVQIL